MSVELVDRWTCDGRECERVVEVPAGGVPDGWVHTMDGRDLCDGCQVTARLERH